MEICCIIESVMIGNYHGGEKRICKIRKWALADLAAALSNRKVWDSFGDGLPCFYTERDGVSTGWRL